MSTEGEATGPTVNYSGDAYSSLNFTQQLVVFGNLGHRNIQSPILITLEDCSFCSKQHCDWQSQSENGQPATASKLLQALCMFSLTLALKHTLLQLVTKLWFGTYPKSFSQGSGTIILQTISASHKYFQSKRLALGTRFPVTLFQSSCQYLQEAQVVYPTSASHSEEIQMFSISSSHAILQTLLK